MQLKKKWDLSQIQKKFKIKHVLSVQTVPTVSKRIEDTFIKYYLIPTLNQIYEKAEEQNFPFSVNGYANVTQSIT